MGLACLELGANHCFHSKEEKLKIAMPLLAKQDGMFVIIFWVMLVGRPLRCE